MPESHGTDPSVTAESSPQEKSKKPLPKFVRYGIVAIVIVLLWMLPFIIGSANTQRAKEKAYQQMVNTLSVSVREPVLLQDRDKLRVLAGEIADRGEFESVTFTDKVGQVLASTDRTKEGEAIASLKSPPIDAKVEQKEGRLMLSRGVTLGKDNVVGGLYIVLKP